MRLIDAQFLKTPWYASHRVAPRPRRQGWRVGHKCIRKFIRKTGLATVCQRPCTSVMHPKRQACTYLLCNLAIARPVKGGCAALTYTSTFRGFLDLVHIMD
jgi:putative transposase